MVRTTLCVPYAIWVPWQPFDRHAAHRFVRVLRLHAEWTSIIKQIRNHPCVFDYTMDNEDINLHFAKDWYSTAKQLDPPRPVNTADGVRQSLALV